MNPQRSLGVARALAKNSVIAVKTVLEEFYPLPGLEEVRTRTMDDHDGKWDCQLVVTAGPDGDMYIGFNKADFYLPWMRFRTEIGGGNSPHTHNALRILAEAIRLDNLEHPERP